MDTLNQFLDMQRRVIESPRIDTDKKVRMIIELENAAVKLSRALWNADKLLMDTSEELT